VVPYSLTNNDGKYMTASPRPISGSPSSRDAFDMLYREGKTQPKMMSVGNAHAPDRSSGRAVGLSGCWTMSRSTTASG